MSLKRCPDCGEKYSDTYKFCPFCEEEQAMEKERPVRRRTGKRTSSRKDPSILTPMLVILILVLALMLGYLFFGDVIKEKLSQGQDPQTSTSQSSGSTSSGSSSQGAGGSGALEPGETDPNSSGGTTEKPGLDSDVAGLPDTLTLSKTDFTIKVGDPTVQLSVNNGSGTYSWISEDDGVASVDENGVVTPISAGTVNIYAADGSGKGMCIVRVKPGAAGNGGSVIEPQPSGGAVSLNRDDFTMGIGDSFQLKISGITTKPNWSSSNPAVATVSGNGTVTGVSKGMATIKMSYDGNSLNCIVRVN